MIDHPSQEFYKKQWQRPGRQFVKKIFPLFAATGIVLTLMLFLFMGLPYLFSHTDLSIKTLSHLLLAIGISVSFIWLGHFLSIRRQSQFQPIRIRIDRKSPPFDH